MRSPSVGFADSSPIGGASQVSADLNPPPLGEGDQPKAGGGGLPPLRREDIVAAARGWIGTPYRHQSSVQGFGCDCLGLVRGVWRELYGFEPEPPPAYRPDWAETGGHETLLEGARRHLAQRPLPDLLAGDVILFRMSPDACIKHAAIVSAAPGEGREGRMIHAYWGRAAVESWIGPWWRTRLAFRFSFPSVVD